MAHFLVTADPITERLADLEKNLRDGDYVSVQPFGKALDEGLRNARVDDEGRATWEEEDYCSPPLAQEREAVLDDYFENVRVEEVGKGEGWKQIETLPRLFPAFASEFNQT